MTDRERPPRLAENGPTELVPTDDGELVERLSSGTATLLLAWLIGIGAGSALLAAWLLAATLFGRRLGADELLSSFGFYVAVFGATGPVVLWLTGRAQGHGLGWWLIKAMKIGLVMIASLVLVGALVALAMNAPLTLGSLLTAAAFAAVTLLLAVLWAVATWSADRYIARARLAGE